jgi:hypothetical protein
MIRISSSVQFKVPSRHARIHQKAMYSFGELRCTILKAYQRQWALVGDKNSCIQEYMVDWSLFLGRICALLEQSVLTGFTTAHTPSFIHFMHHTQKLTTAHLGFTQTQSPQTIIPYKERNNILLSLSKNSVSRNESSSESNQAPWYKLLFLQSAQRCGWTAWNVHH